MNEPFAHQTYMKVRVPHLPDLSSGQWFEGFRFLLHHCSDCPGRQLFNRRGKKFEVRRRPAIVIMAGDRHNFRKDEFHESLIS